MKLTFFRSVPFLRKGHTAFAGRNSNGKITVRHRGGGHKQAFRQIDWQRTSGSGFVVGFEYDPFRNSNLAKLYHPSVSYSPSSKQQQQYSYVVASTGLKLFQELNTYTQGITTSFTKLLRSGDKAPLSYYEPGDFIHNVEAFPGQGPRFARSAGTFCQVRSQSRGNTSDTNLTNIGVFGNTNRAKVRLPSGSQRLVSLAAQATVGIVSESLFNRENLEKAGRSRWLGRRPSVRGVARNPVDHPHGGGQGKTSGGRPSVTFKGWPTKGQPTRNPKRRNSLILTPRNRK